jgi:cyanophycinase
MGQKKRESLAGELIIIGGHEDKGSEPEILKTVAERADKGLLLIATLASSLAKEQWEEYRKVFGKLGVKKLDHLDLETRAESADDRRVELVKQAKVIFFTGGDQLRITSSFGGSRLCELMREKHSNGMPIAGTSAGASVMSETMLVSGPGDESHKPADALRMAPGLGLMKEIVIDQHFAQRGRISRLLVAVAQNPRLLGVGLDENTAIVAKDGAFEVIGAGAVYVINGMCITYTNLSESDPNVTTSVHGVRLDVLSRGDRYDLDKRVALHA